MIALRILMAFCAWLLIVAPARAELKICNDMTVDAKVALVIVYPSDQSLLVPADIDPNATRAEYEVQGWWRIPSGTCQDVTYIGVAWGARWEPWNFNFGVDASWPKFPVRDADFHIVRSSAPASARRVAFSSFGGLPLGIGGKIATLRLFRVGGAAFYWE